MYCYAVSACLAGHFCRYNGKSSPCAHVLKLVAERKAFPLCPEVLGGLATPREPVEIFQGKVVTRQAKDVSKYFYCGAHKALLMVQELGCTAAILKTRSPSCARDEIYDGSFSGKLVQGQGVFAKLLQDNNFTIYTEEDLPPECTD